jgi:hypothetical protein
MQLSTCFVFLERGADEVVAVFQRELNARSADITRRPSFPARVLAAVLEVSRADLLQELRHVGHNANAVLKDKGDALERIAVIGCVVRRILGFLMRWAKGPHLRLPAFCVLCAFVCPLSAS